MPPVVTAIDHFVLAVASTEAACDFNARAPGFGAEASNPA